MKIKYKKVIKILIFGTVFFCIYFIFFKTKTSSLTLNHHIPEWLLSDIGTDSVLTGQEPGPLISSSKEAYGAIRIRFFDSSTNMQITDPAILEELLALFQYSADPFVYDIERSRNGTCFFYYNGIMEERGPYVSLFTGFKGDKEINKKVKIREFYMKFDSTILPASFSNDIQKALNEINH